MGQGEKWRAPIAGCWGFVGVLCSYLSINIPSVQGGSGELALFAIQPTVVNRCSALLFSILLSSQETRMYVKPVAKGRDGV